MSFGLHLKKLRKGRGVTQEELANSIGKHVTQIKRYENNGSEPTVSVLLDIAKALDVSLDKLILNSDSHLTEVDISLKESFQKIVLLPENKKKTILDLLDAFIKQNMK